MDQGLSSFAWKGDDIGLHIRFRETQVFRNHIFPIKNLLDVIVCDLILIWGMYQFDTTETYGSRPSRQCKSSTKYVAKTEENLQFIIHTMRYKPNTRSHRFFTSQLLIFTNYQWRLWSTVQYQEEWFFVRIIFKQYFASE